MSKFLTDLALKLSNIQVVHSIPGRLRVKIPGLDLAESSLSEINAIHPSGIFKLKGIEKLEFSFLTSKLLIHYNQELINEERILRFLKIVRELLVEKAQEKNMVITAESIAEIIEKLKAKGFELT